jgi:capsular exopolysaccharide synthesis family protein
MSKFLQALERAEQDRVLQKQPIREKSQKFFSESRAPSPILPVSMTHRSPTPERQEEIVCPTKNGHLVLERMDPHLVSLLGTMAPEAEQYRRICCLIEGLHRNANLSVLAVTSPTVGDGKTTTSINLAGTLAQTPEAKVLLIDLDLRRPSVAHALGLSAHDSPGLVDTLLQGHTSVSEVLRYYPQFNLTVLPAGKVSEVPHQVLKSPRLEEVFAEMRQQYDYIIVDTPPLLPFPDCQLITRWLDGFVMIIAAHRTPREMVEAAIPLVESEKMVGLIFTGNDHSMPDYSSYYRDQSFSRKEIGLAS